MSQPSHRGNSAIDRFAVLMNEANRTRLELLHLSQGGMGVNTKDGKTCLRLADAARRVEELASELLCKVMEDL